MVPYLMVDEVIDRALMWIRAHPLFKDPIVLNGAGQPLRITKLRNFDGLDTNSTGLTLSIFPYAYMGTSNETTTSGNVALTFRPYTLGGKDSGFDIASLTLVVKLSIQGVENKTEVVDPGPHKVVYERSMREVALYKWIPVMRSILLTNPVSDLAGLVSNSTVNWGSFRSVAWNKGPGTSDKGENAVFHSASLLWQLDFFAPRNWREYPSRVPLPGGDSGSTWEYVGIRSLDCEAVYFDTSTELLVTLAGFPLLTTPKGLEVKWDPTVKQVVKKSDSIPLTTSEMEDPRTDPVKPWIDLNLLLAGYLGDAKLLWNKTAAQFQKCDGTVVTSLPDGTPLCFNASTQQVTHCGTGTPIPPSDDFTPLNVGRVSIYDANSLALRDTFRL